MRSSNHRELEKEGVGTNMIRVVLLDCEVGAPMLETNESSLRAADVIVEGGGKEHGLLDDVVFLRDH
jgi:hypothetical protein